MDLGRIFKWIVIAAILFFAWKLVGPMLQKPMSSTTSDGGSADNSCIAAAARASETWGSGIGRFVNSDDSTAWETFRGNVEMRIGAAESACDCADQSCQTARIAMGDLRAIVGDVDNAFRSNSGPPTDIVQRQEAVDNQIDTAREQVRAGR
ncbi:MAG TPA: hypothetical protein VF057_04615 [Thermoanaerobaculia bacterium]